MNWDMAIIIALVTALLLDLLATWQILRNPLCSGSEKLAQLLLVWILPLAGAVVCLLVLGVDHEPMRASPPESFTDNLQID